MLADRKWSIGTGSGIRRLIGLVVTLLLAVAGLSQPALASADTPTVGSCTFDSLGEDAFTYDDPGRAAAITTDTSLVCTEQHEFAQAPTPARHAYDSVRCCVAPSAAVDDVALGLRGSGDVGGVANRDWIAAGLADEGPFVQRFYQAMYRSTSHGGRIRFNLDGLDLDRALTTSRFSDPFDVGATNWELQQILANPQFRGATDFYLDGQILSADRVASLGLGG